MYKEQIKKIKECVSKERVRFKKQALIRAIERNISISEIVEALSTCKIIMEYPEGKPFVSYLVSGFTMLKRPIHSVIAINEIDEYIWIITVYEPDKNLWDKTFTRKL